MTEENRDYKQQLEELFECYVDGKKALINAKGWDVTIAIKPEFAHKNPPSTFLSLADEAIRIVAHGKFGLDTYANTIQIITAEQMRDAYSKNGMPVSYDHWSFGKNLIQMDQAYNAGKMGLAYEIVINTDPAIAYCMETNSKSMQMLVIAHASYGHNSFFKGNHMFRQFTKADNILEDLKTLKRSVEKCETLFGAHETERVLDACHALENSSVNRYTRPPKKSPEEAAALRRRIREEDQFNYDDKMYRLTEGFNKDTSKEAVAKTGTVMEFDEENILTHIANYAPHMEEEKRELIRNFCVKSQYFYPQRQTQLMNEGWASFWHHNILNELYDQDIVSDGMMLEILNSHSGVIFQPDYDSKYFSGINVYALGIAMFQDIRRICLDPTPEDKKWFPHFAGNPDWVSVVKDAMENYKDESFVMQYLSPKIIRDFHLFSFRDDDREPLLEVTAIHNDEGYKEVRAALSRQYDLGSKMPSLKVSGYDFRGDRSLILEHEVYNRKPLDKDDMSEVMKHIHYLWKHPVVLHDRDVETNAVSFSMRCAPSADGRVSKIMLEPV